MNLKLKIVMSIMTLLMMAYLGFIIYLIVLQGMSFRFTFPQ